MPAIDKWAMEQLEQLIDKVRDAYDNFMFHRVFQLIYNFCTVQMSSIYMDVLKDRLYCDGKDSASRRSAQTAMQRITDALVRMLAPVLAHTSEEAWAAMKNKSQEVETVHLAIMPQVDEAIDYKNALADWDKIMQLRDEVMKKLEGLRQEQTIASNQESSVVITLNDAELAGLVNNIGADAFAALCIVSEVKLVESDEFKIEAQKCSFGKCERCWNYWESVGSDEKHPDLCSRCVEVVS